MIIVMKQGAAPDQLQAVIGRISELGFRSHVSQGAETTIVGVIGDERRVSENVFRMMPGVDTVVRVLAIQACQPRVLPRTPSCPSTASAWARAARDHRRAVRCRAASRSSSQPGPSKRRAGASSRRRSAAHLTYSFQGLGPEGLALLAEVRELTGLAIITEVMAPEQVPDVAAAADILQIGTRNMQNYNLLHAVGASLKPALLKRGMMSTMEELLMSAEYILSHDNPNVMLCDAASTFERHTRNTLDISAVPVLKELTHLPVLIDLSTPAAKPVGSTPWRAQRCGRRRWAARRGPPTPERRYPTARNPSRPSS